MFLYLAYGTYDFLEKVKQKHSAENMLLLASNENACLLHETTKKTIFHSPKKFEEVIAIGQYNQASIASFTYIPVSKEGEPILEFLFKKNEDNHEAPGLIALRALKPIKSDTYLVITFWDDTKNCQNWISAINNQQLSYNHFLNGMEKLTQISKKPYNVTYSISK